MTQPTYMAGPRKGYTKNGKKIGRPRRARKAVVLFKIGNVSLVWMRKP